MPLVIVKVDPKIVPEETITNVLKKLPKIVATALSVKGNKNAKLKANHVEIEYKEHGPRDKNTKPFQFRIIANDYPERRETIEKRRALIILDIKLAVAKKLNLDAYVWVQLVEGSYGEFRV